MIWHKNLTVYTTIIKFKKYLTTNAIKYVKYDLNLNYLYDKINIQVAVAYVTNLGIDHHINFYLYIQL